MKTYELTVVLDGKASATKKKAVETLVEKTVSLTKGKIASTEEWGVKDLAYKIQKSPTGLFLHFVIELEAEEVKNLSNKLRASDDVIRYLVIGREK